MNQALLTINDKMVVSLDYTARFDDGEMLDSSAEHGPLQYIHGTNMIIPGLEQELTGMCKDEARQIVVPPARAYGELIDVEPEWFPISIFPDDVNLAPGLAFQAEDGEGDIMTLYVQEVEADRVLVSYNHPLAGQTLHFEVTVVDVRPATTDELAHGHVHSGTHH